MFLKIFLSIFYFKILNPMSLIEELEKKLQGGKFRLLNEKLYKNKELSPEEAKQYHVFYENQIKKWPSDPKQVIINKIKEDELSELKIADLGCGSAEISKKYSNVISFDLYPTNDKVIKCSISDIKSENNEFDVAVCCLSLMKTNITGELREVNRILKKEGIFYLAEVSSRIKNTKKFINDVEKLGFKLKNIDKNNSYFTVFSFIKKEDILESKKLPSIFIQDWKYKKR